jgi:serralysin
LSHPASFVSITILETYAEVSMQPVSRHSDSFRQKLVELFAPSRKVRTRRSERRGGHEQRDVFSSVERMEDRALLTASSLLANGVVESHADAVFAPDTLPEYANAINDFVGAAGATGADSFNLSSRWSTTATNGSGLGQGDPTTLTWSIVPDGTGIPALGGITGESTAGSNLVSFLGGIYGVTTNDTIYTDEPWFGHFESVFDRWSELTGLTYVYSAADDGIAFTNTTANPGVLGVRGDVRIGGHYIDGPSNVLAYNFYPNHGDMIIDTGDTFFNSTGSNSLGLRNTIAHEAGHGIGLSHVASNNAGFLMEPFVSLSFDGPQLDDILAAQRHYGDAFEPNDVSGTAIDLGALSAGQTVTIGGDANDTVIAATDTSIVSIDDNLDSDFYSFTVATAVTVDLTLTPLGPTYNQGPQGGTQSALNTATLSDLILELRDTNGTSVLVSANANPAGQNETISFALPSAGTYYTTVGGLDDTVQAYALTVAAAPVFQPELTLNIQAAAISEASGTGATTATVSRNSDMTNALMVTLLSDDTSEATVQTTITIPAGQTTSAAFNINAVNDSIVDGAQTVTITAAATGHTSSTDIITVTDDDAPTLSVDVLATSISEASGASATTVTITRNTGSTSPMVVHLTSSDTSEATIQSTATIPAGQFSVTVPLNAVNDSLIDGNQTVTVSAAEVTASTMIPDSTFGSSGIVGTNLRWGIQYGDPELIQQPDGKLLAIGRHLTIDDTWQIVRLNSNGSFDDGFGINGIVNTAFIGETSVRPTGIAVDATTGENHGHRAEFHGQHPDGCKIQQ